MQFWILDSQFRNLESGIRNQESGIHYTPFPHIVLANCTEMDYAVEIMVYI